MSGWDLTGTSGASVRSEDSGGDAVLTVTQAITRAAGAIDAIPRLTVLGEVTGFRGPNARSGHCYFQIKDESSAIDAVIWKRTYAARAFDLRDGLKLNMTGRFNIYKPIGKMSFVVDSFSLEGEGLLRQQVAQLAEKLRREGLMDESRKRHIPVFCTRVAVVTSLSGAVIDDVKRTLRRRNPLVELVCVGAKVQGEGAPAELIEGLRRAAAITPAPDCILLVRGGGSFEDLMTFNDEALARAVAASPIPVVTGIGHEPDTSICDMVSDRRSSTPTAAAESVAPAMGDLVEVLGTRERRLAQSFSAIVHAAQVSTDTSAQALSRAMDDRLSRLSLALDAYASRPVLTRPTATVERRHAELAQTEDRLVAAGEHVRERFSAELARVEPQLHAAARASMATARHALALDESKLRTSGSALVRPHQAELAAAAAKLDALSPLKVLARGYSIAYDGAGSVATHATSFSPGDALRVRMADGDVYGTVTDVIAN